MKNAVNVVTLTFAQPVDSIGAMKRLITAVGSSGIALREMETANHAVVVVSSSTPVKRRKYTKRATGTTKRGTKRVLSPARSAAIKKAQAARWAGHKKKS